jgi:mersacidin/lichenicidin family type 2 lantibiotic
MSNDMIIKAWKDPMFRASLGREHAGQMPQHPCGAIDLAELTSIVMVGTDASSSLCGHGCCPDAPII